MTKQGSTFRTWRSVDRAGQGQIPNGRENVGKRADGAIASLQRPFKQGDRDDAQHQRTHSAEASAARLSPSRGSDESQGYCKTVQRDSCERIAKEIQDIEGMSNSLYAIWRIAIEAGGILKAPSLCQKGKTILGGAWPGRSFRSPRREPYCRTFRRTQRGTETSVNEFNLCSLQTAGMKRSVHATS